MELQKLLPIEEQPIGEGQIQTVNGERLHSALEVGDRFDQWIKRRINELGFLINSDFCTILCKTNGRPKEEYHLSLDMAKEIAMTEKNKMGKFVRRYFIACEKELKEFKEINRPLFPAEEVTLIMAESLKLANLLKIPKSTMLIEGAKSAYNKTGIDYRNAVTHSEYCNNIQGNEVMLEPTELADELGISSAIMMNRKLAELGLQNKKGKKWVPTPVGKQLSIRHQWSKDGKSGYNLKWNPEKVKNIILDRVH